MEGIHDPWYLTDDELHELAQLSLLVAIICGPDPDFGDADDPGHPAGS